MNKQHFGFRLHVNKQVVCQVTADFCCIKPAAVVTTRITQQSTRESPNHVEISAAHFQHDSTTHNVLYCHTFKALRSMWVNSALYLFFKSDSMCL